MKYIDAEDLKPRLTDGGEIAFIDVREHGQYGAGHPFFIASIPYSQLELLVEMMLPNKSINIVLMDNGDGVAEKAQKRLGEMGYSSVDIMKGGVAAWVDAGFTLYEGVNLPSKTLGELIEHVAGTPRITAQQLMAMMAGDEDFMLVDGRTPEEFRTMMIGNGICCPNAELGHRLPQLLSSNTTKIIVNCAGRTRSIIGAQGLINQGFDNPVFALENGTQGWELAGYEVTRGAADNLPHDLDEKTLGASQERAADLRQKFDIKQIDLATLVAWQGDDTRTTYVFDIRTKEEFIAGHLAKSRHAPGGQLVQSTDKRAGARGARIVLVDDTGLRAANTAVWLQQMSHEVYVLNENVTTQEGLERGLVPEKPIVENLPLCPASKVTKKLENGAILLDLNKAMDYRKGHIAGARWTIRPRLGEFDAGPDVEFILIAADRRVAELAAIDLGEMGAKNISFLAGDADTWAKAGLEIVATPDQPADKDCIDYLFFTHDRHVGNLEAARGYLAWELALIDQLDEQERSFYQLDFYSSRSA